METIIPVTIEVKTGDEISLNFHPRLAEGEIVPGQAHVGETVVLTLEQEQVSIRHSENFKISTDQAPSLPGKDLPSPVALSSVPDIQVSSREGEIHLQIPNQVRADFDVEVEVHGMNSVETIPLKPDDTSLKLSLVL